jgi:hypothetical protein
MMMMMKIKSIIIVAFLALYSTLLLAQCDTYSYQMQEIVSDIYEIENNVAEAYLNLRKVKESKENENLQEYLKVSLDFVNTGITASENGVGSSQSALIDAENCICVTGANCAAELEILLGEIEEMLKETKKILKKARKLKFAGDIKKSAYRAMQILEAIPALIDVAEEEAQDGIYKCN